MEPPSPQDTNLINVLSRASYKSSTFYMFVLSVLSEIDSHIKSTVLNGRD